MIKKNVTMSDIAKAMNISTVSVSKALGGREGVSDALRERVKQKAAEMGYRSHSGRAAPQGGFSYNIGVIADKNFISEPSAVCRMLYKQLVEFLQKRNYYGILEIAGNEEDGVCAVPQSVSEKKIDGMILLGSFSEEYVERLMSFYIPAVFLDFHGDRADADVVMSDSFYGMYRLTSYLIANGHRKIGFVGNVNHTAVQDRYLGFYKALLENHLALRFEWVIPDRADGGGLYSSYELPAQLPTAFVCNSDETAYKLITQLAGRGFKIPEDISVIGYENSTYSTMCTPHITTMDMNTFEMASEAVEIILQKVRDRSFRSGRRLVEGKPVYRDSVRNLFD